MSDTYESLGPQASEGEHSQAAANGVIGIGEASGGTIIRLSTTFGMGQGKSECTSWQHIHDLTTRNFCVLRSVSKGNSHG